MTRSVSPFSRLGAVLLRWAAVCSCTLGAACGTDPCNAQIPANGESYDVYVTDLAAAPPYPSGPSYPASRGSCMGLDGIVPGATLSFQTVGARDDNPAFCRYATAELLTGPAPLTPRSALSDPLLGKPGITGSLFMEAFADVTTPACSGALVIVFLEDGLMYRLFLPSIGSCSVCDDNFTIQLAGL